MTNVGLNVVLPLFGVMATGYVAGRTGMLSREGSAALSRFVFVFALSALVFIALARVKVSDFFDWPFIGALGGGMAIMFALSMIFARFVFPDTLTAHGLHALSGMYSSTGYVGLPIVLMVFGDKELIPGIIGTVVTGAVFLPLTVLIAEIDRGRREGRVSFKPLLDVVKTPVLVATVAGLAVSAAGIPVPQPISRFCDILAGAFVPCSLFAAGLFIAGCSVEGEKKEIAWLTLVKMVLHPALSWWLAYHLFHLPGNQPAIVVIQAALPTGVPVFVLAQQYGAFVTRASAVVVVTTALSVVSLTALILLLAP